LQIDTVDLLLIITSTADELSGVPTSMTLNDLEIDLRLLVIGYAYKQKYSNCIRVWCQFPATCSV